jgi:methionyl-tRNA formyltransferase
MKIAFFGTPAFAAESLKSLAEAGFEISAVITAPDKPAGRGQKLQMSDVKKTALEMGLLILQPEKLKSTEFIEQFKSLDVDLGVVIAFRMLPEIVWSAPKLGTVNLHASLLPDYRGAAPINHAIINGETLTGVSTFFLKHEIDTGDIILRESIEISPTENASSLHDKLMVLGSRTIVSTVKLIELHREKTPVTAQIISQNPKLAPKIFRDFCELSTSLNSVDFYNKVRGLSSYPGAWIKSPWGDLKIMACMPISEFILQDIQNQNQQSLGNSFYLISKSLFVKTIDSYIEVIELQAAGKPKMKSTDFINGLRL